MSNGEPEDIVAPVCAVDLDRQEAAMRASSGCDLTEAKEALVDALLGLTVRRCTGDGAEGAIIYSVRPSAKLVSGFLLPRFDPTGQQDETSDIRIATMGMDFQLAAAGGGEVVVQPELSIYVRVLPTWDELSDPRHDMAPRMQLSRDARRQVDDRAAAYIREQSATLPPVEDQEDAERAGDALANADQTRDTADRAEEAQAEGGRNDAESAGEVRAAAQVAERAERIADTRKAANGRRSAARRERDTLMSAIRREAFDRAFRELGIHLRINDESGGRERPVTAGDLIEPEQTDLSDASLAGDAEAPMETDDPEQGAPIAAGAASLLRRGVGRIDDRFAAPQPIPQKWKRFAMARSAGILPSSTPLCGGCRTWLRDLWVAHSRGTLAHRYL